MKDKSQEEIENLWRRSIEDFIVFTFFVGNDFLPQIPSLQINNDGIETIIDLYAENIKENGPLLMRNDNNYVLRKSSFKPLLKKLAD